MLCLYEILLCNSFANIFLSLASSRIFLTLKDSLKIDFVRHMKANFKYSTPGSDFIAKQAYATKENKRVLLQ